MDKKICVVSMSVGKPASMTAAWINNELIMAERTSYPERRRDMELQLLRELREKEEKGFIVLVEEENSFITGRVGQRVRLRDPFMNSRPVLIEAMQIYKALERQKAIKLPRKESGKYILHQSIFDSEHDKKGDEFFNINWSEITTEYPCADTKASSARIVNRKRKFFLTDYLFKNGDRCLPFLRFLSRGATSLRESKLFLLHRYR